MEHSLLEIMMYITLGAIGLWMAGMIIWAIVTFSKWLLHFLPASHWH